MASFLMTPARFGMVISLDGYFSISVCEHDVNCVYESKETYFLALTAIRIGGTFSAPSMR